MTVFERFSGFLGPAEAVEGLSLASVASESLSGFLDFSVTGRSWDFLRYSEKLVENKGTINTIYP